MQPATKPTRTAADRAAEEALRQQLEANPIRQRPAATLNQRSVGAIVGLLSRFKKLRDSKGLKLDLVAERMGIDAAELSRLESGKILSPTLATLHQWAQALDAELETDLTDHGQT